MGRFAMPIIAIATVCFLMSLPISSAQRLSDSENISSSIGKTYFLGTVKEISFLKICKRDVTVFDLEECKIEEIKVLPYNNGFAIVGIVKDIPLGEEVFIHFGSNNDIFVSFANDIGKEHKLLVF